MSHTKDHVKQKRQARKTVLCIDTNNVYFSGNLHFVFQKPSFYCPKNLFALGSKAVTHRRSYVCLKIWIWSKTDPSFKPSPSATMTANLSGAALTLLSALILNQVPCCGMTALSPLILGCTRLTWVPCSKRGPCLALPGPSFTLWGPSRAQQRWRSCKWQDTSPHRLVF